MLINPLLANIGLPMVAVYLPFAWFALVPIILIEAGYGTRRYRLSFSRALLAQAIANGFSTVIDIPMTWFAIVLVQVAIAPGGIGPAWLVPDPSLWSIALAAAVLTVVFYSMSVVTEGFVVTRFFREVPRQTIRRWIIQSNAITYVLLLALLSAGLLAPKVSEPMVNLMQPVNDGIVSGVFWVIDQVSGKRDNEPPLIQAVEAGDLKKVQKLISKRANVNQTDSFGFSALSYAARAGDEKMAQLFIEFRRRG
jgi:ankyrin repeat protein